MFAQLPDDRRLFYTRQGSGTPLLLIMGMGGHHRLWRADFVDLLAESYDVIAYDHRGVGESTDVRGAFTTAQLADDAVALLDAIGVDAPHVFGISMGGMVAQELVLAAPGRVRRLALGCTYCGGPRTNPMAPGPMRMMTAMNTGRIEDAIRAGYEANLSPAWVADDAHWPQFRDVVLSVPLPQELILRQAQAAFAHDTSGRLPSVTTPTLVLAGTADEMVLYQNNEVIVSLLPDASMHQLPGVGHLFWWERPAEVAAALRDHLG